MIIHFPPHFESDFQSRFNITRKDVISTVTNPLQKQKITLHDFEVLFFLQKELNSDTYLLVMGSLKGDLFGLEECFRLRHELIQKAGTEEPLALLQQLAFNFGVTLKIGDKEGKFFLHEFVQVPKGADFSEIIETYLPPNSEVKTSMFLNYKREIGIAEIAIAFAIEQNSYRAWLNKQTSVKVSLKRYDVFISYKRNTAKDFALNLKHCLTQEGYIAFLDLTDIPKEFEGTEKWFNERDEAIKNSKRLLLIITIKIETSTEVVKELMLARAIPKMKFIYMRHNVLKSQIILKTSDNNVIDLSEGNQETFSNEDDLVRKVLQILQDSDN